MGFRYYYFFCNFQYFIEVDCYPLFQKRKMRLPWEVMESGFEPRLF